MKKYLVNGMLIVLSAAVLVNLVFMYREFTDNVSAISDYDYRIAIFGNDGIYPEEVVTFAQNLDKNLPKVTIENPPIYFDAEGYNVMCVALDDDTFEKCYKMPEKNQKPYAVLSSLYSTGMWNMDDINVMVGNTEIEILGISGKEIPLGAMSNIYVPTLDIPTLVLITNQNTANHLYEISSFTSATHQRQISVYYQTNDGKKLTKQMESFSPRNISDVQIWDNQDYSDNSVWYFCTIIKRIMLLACLIVIMLLTEYKRILEKQKIKNDNIQLKQQIKLSMENLAILRDTYAEQRKITHDFNNHISTIKSLLDSENTEKAKEYVHSLAGKSLGKTILFNSNNPVVDVLLTQKYNAAKQHNINMQVKIDDLSNLPMKDEELVVVLSNLLDNAIEAAKQSVSEKIIKLKFISDNDGYILSVHNTTNENSRFGGQDIVSSKEDKLNHGYGVKNIKTILEKYGYEYTISNKDGKVAFVILMQR